MANKVSFEEFSKNTSLLKTSKGWDEDGDAIVDITLKSKPNSNFDFKYSVKNVKIDDYLTDRRLNFPIQIKEHIYNKFYKETKMSKGGKIKSTFDEKVKAISKRLVGQKVPKKYKKEYGATYDKAEAKQAGRRIAGSQLVKLKEKMEKMRKAKKKS
jgi:hypothetical protein